MAANPSIVDSGEWVLVPREPTEAMVRAARDRPSEGMWGSLYEDVYRAMLSASPPSPPAVWSGEDSLSQSQPCGDGAQPILPPDAEPSAVRIGPRFVDDFNGDDDHLLDSIDALLRLNADGALSHRIPGLARQLLHNAAARLEARQMRVWIHTDGQCFGTFTTDPKGYCSACGNHGMNWALRWPREGAPGEAAGPAIGPSHRLDEPENSPSPLPRLGDGG